MHGPVPSAFLLNKLGKNGLFPALTSVYIRQNGSVWKFIRRCWCLANSIAVAKQGIPGVQSKSKTERSYVAQYGGHQHSESEHLLAGVGSIQCQCQLTRMFPP